MDTIVVSRSEHPTDGAAAAWHCQNAADVAASLNTSLERGLTPAEAAARLKRHGPNAIREGERRPPWRMLLDQFTDFMIIVLMVAAVVSGFVGDLADTIAIMVIVVLNAIVGFVQEYRAEQAMAALKKLAAATALVLRDGRVEEIPTAELVPGDVVLLGAGNVVPADLRLFEAIALRIEEAALTGESVAVEKQADALTEADLPLGDRYNLAYKGTIVAYGRGRGVVVAAGMQTELGKIATLLSSEGDVKTPLQRRLTQFGRRLAVIALLICAGVFVFGVARGDGIALMFLTAVSLAVAAIPEALPAVVTISLALGARKMVAKNALIRRLPAVEALGSVTFICTDKTGTLTQNRMRVEELYVDGRRRRQWSRQDLEDGSIRLLFQAVVLNNDATIADGGREIGDPTEIALLLAGRELDLEKDVLEAEAPRIAELPFDSVRKSMTTVHRAGTGVIGYTKGAPEQVLDNCGARHGGTRLTSAEQQTILATAEQMAADGLRVIAVAYRTWDSTPVPLTPEDAETGLIFIGLVGMIDPPRPEAAGAVETCKTAGITPVMVTGDHPATALAIATRLGIAADHGRVITGREMARLTPAQFADQVKQIRVYARVDPSQKIMIVSGLQAQGEYVAMTGDGVNYAPAIKRAEIGVAMGKIGTDVAREASSMVLLDDNFATIVGAVQEGRRIYDNIRKFIRFVMGGNSGEILTIVSALLLGLPIPLVPIQILWINLVTDGLPGLALAVEPEEPAIMRRPPRRPAESVFAHGMWQHIVWVGVLMGAISIGIQYWALQAGSSGWQTMVFTAITMCQMYHVLAIRSERESLFTIGFLSNLPLLGAVLLTVALQLATIYVPWLNPIFKTEPLSGTELAIVMLAPMLVFIGVEIEKWMVRRGWIYTR